MSESSKSVKRQLFEAVFDLISKLIFWIFAPEKTGKPKYFFVTEITQKKLSFVIWIIYRRKQLESQQKQSRIEKTNCWNNIAYKIAKNWISVYF